MNSVINLGSEIFTDADIVEMLVLASRDRFVTIFDPKGSKDESTGEVKRQVLPDFGTVFIGFESIEQVENLDLFMDASGTPMVAPETWKVGHLVKRFGMFPSQSQAAKNGFGSDIPVGFSQVLVRVNKLRGVISILKG